ncbi:MAG: ferrous iron transport protein A, partial [Candidatus Bathyarchaeota archaeon]|nr:ferrous iron transport protein A [Candidatus Bathyarchaeota archaeon]
PFRGPSEVEVRGATLALGRGLAGHVLVEVEDGRLVAEHPHPHGPHH